MARTQERLAAPKPRFLAPALKRRTFSNTHPRREAAENIGIALMLSGSYVLSSLDQDEYDLLRRTSLADLSFSGLPSVVITNGESKSKRGKLARIAHLSSNGRFVRYRHPVFGSRNSISTLALIAAIAHTPTEFLGGLSRNETLHVRRLHDRKEFTGILVGSDEHLYCSLLIPSSAPPGFDFLDLETEANAHNARALVSIVERNPVKTAELINSLSAPYPSPQKR